MKKWLFALTLSASIVAGNASAQQALNRVYSNSGASSQWFKTLGVDGKFTTAQPAFSDISGILGQAQFPTKLNIIDYNGSASGSDYANGGSWAFSRVANYNGGTSGAVLSGIRAYNNVGGNGSTTPTSTVEVAAIGITDCYGSSTEQCVGISGQASQYTAGSTWGIVTEVWDRRGTSDSATGLIGYELDVFASGTDSNGSLGAGFYGNRYGQAILAGLHSVPLTVTATNGSPTLTVTANGLNLPTGSALSYGVQSGFNLTSGASGFPAGANVSGSPSGATITMSANYTGTTGSISVTATAPSVVIGVGLLVSPKDYGLAAGALQSFKVGAQFRGSFAQAVIDANYATGPGGAANFNLLRGPAGSSIGIGTTNTNFSIDLAGSSSTYASAGGPFARFEDTTGTIVDTRIGSSRTLDATGIGVVGTFSANDFTIYSQNAVAARFYASASAIIQPLSVGVNGTVGGSVELKGATTGSVKLTVPAAAGSGTITLPVGTTNFSSTGPGVVQQASSGAAFTVGTLGVGLGGTGTTTQFTQGSIVYAGASGVYSQNAANFYYDGSIRVGIGTNTLFNVANYGELGINGSSGSFLTMRANGVANFKIQTDAVTYFYGLNNTVPLLFGNNETETFRLVAADATFQLAAPMIAANGSVATTMTSLGPTGSHTTVQEWMVVRNASGTLRYIPMY